MNCSEIKNKMIAYLENDLSEAGSIAFRQHLSKCDNCMHIYNKVKEQWQIIEDEKLITADAFYFTRLQQAVENIPQKKERGQYALAFRTIRNIAAILLLLISVAGGIFIGSQITGATVTSSESEYEYFSEMM